VNVLLINPTRGYEFVLPKGKKVDSPNLPPLGLLYVGRSLLDEGHKVKVLDLSAERNPSLNLEEYLNSTDAVGITATSYPYQETAEIAKKIKEIDPSISVIIGGPHCSFHPKQSLIDVPDADISVSGDGEQTIKDVAAALNGKGKLSEVHGIYYRTRQGIKKGKPVKLITDLDSIPFPARHLVDKYNYGMSNNLYFFKPKITSTSTTRGCPFCCRFCSRNEHIKKFRQRSVDNVVEEIIELNDAYGTVIITDENFLTDTRRAHKIFDKLIEQKSNIDLVIEGSRVDTAEKKLYKKMKKAGVKFIAYGIESGNQSVLDFYDKKITLNQIRKAVKLANKMGFICWANFILGAPIETEKHIEQTIKFACSLKLDIALFTPLFYMWGSRMWHEAIQQGKISTTDGYSIQADSKLGLSNFSGDELWDYCEKASKRFFYRPSYALRVAKKAIMTMNFRFLRIQIKSM